MAVATLTHVLGEAVEKVSFVSAEGEGEKGSGWTLTWPHC